MWCYIVAAAALVATVAGQSSVSYEGTLLPEGTVFLLPTGQQQQQQQQQQVQQFVVPPRQQQQQQQQFPQPQPAFVVPAFQKSPKLLAVPLGQQQQVSVVQGGQGQPYVIPLPAEQQQQQQQQQPPQPPVFTPAVQPPLPSQGPAVFVVGPQPVPSVVPAAAAAPQFVAAGPQQDVAQGFLPQPPAACPATQSLAHASFRDSHYHLSWCRQPDRTFTHQQAADYCLTLNYLQQDRHYEVLSVDDLQEPAFIRDLLTSYLRPAVWTKHTSNTALYSVRPFINRSGGGQPGNDCLSMVALLFSHNQWLQERRCTDQQLVICEAR